MPLTLTREIRFGLHKDASLDAPQSSNGFAANPALVGIAPFLTLSTTISGTVDPATGMLINIKLVDKILRDLAVPAIRDAHYARHLTAEQTLAHLWPLLKDRFQPHRLDQLTLSPSRYLTFSLSDKEPAMVRLSLRFEFSAAHRLHSAALSEEKNQEVFGRCTNANGHGHNYELEVTLAGTPASSGQLIAIPLLQQIVNQQIIEPFDHKHLNLDCPEFRTVNPTVENIAAALFHRLQPHIPAPARLASLRVWETPKTMCEYSA